jgi:hypothetical protein
MKRYLWVKNAAGAAIFLLACGISAAGLVTAMQSSQQPDQSQQQGQQGQPPSKDKDKDKQQKKKGQGNTQDNAQGNAQDNTQPANNPANPPAGSGAQPSDKPTGGGKPAPLFGGSLSLKSSRQTKDTATMGFNGVDPNGQVQKSFLTAAATNADRSKAQQVAGYKVDPQELAQFIQDAELNPNAAAPPQKSK